MKKSYIRFDWAMKHLLRDKANFAVLEGLITTLLGEKMTIQKLLESESNQEDEDDKYNRVDILAENDKGEIFIIEIQNNNEYAYFQRMLFGTSKLVTEYINRGQGYDKIRKIYSINIVYFNLGNGTDVVYHGKTEFRGIHNNELLSLSPFQQQKFEVSEVSELYPEYYILKVNDFDRWSKVPLEQWIYFLNTGEIPEEADAPGLKEAREKLELDRMSKSRDPISAKLVADLISAAGADRVLTMDLHAAQIQGFFNIPLDHMEGMPILSQYIERKNLEDLVIVSPDLGSVNRARKIANRLDVPIAIIDKRRPKPNVSEIMNIIGEIKDKNLLIIDDIIDTAGTLCNAANALKERGAKSVRACATHGILSGPAIERIEASALEELILLDTIPLADEKKLDKIKVETVAPLFAQAIQRIYADQSVSTLFNL